MAEALKMIEETPYNWRQDFPILSKTMNDKPLVYLDSASSAQKPMAVIQKMTAIMNDSYSNIHRGLYNFSQVLTEEYEGVRCKIRNFLNIPDSYSVIFTRNTTESINLVADSWGNEFLIDGDEIILSDLEHHANIVPWQLLNKNNNIKLKIIPINEQSSLDLEVYASLITERTRLIAITHVSNSIGIVNNINQIIRLARKINSKIKVLIDGSQAVVHKSVDLSKIDADFYVFTGHKLYGPTGTGVLIAKTEILNDMPPYQGGGDMIETVSFEQSTFKPPPHKFEAGTPAILEVLGLGAAVDYLVDIGMEAVEKHEKNLLSYAMKELQDIDGLTIYGDMLDKAPIISFTAEWGHISDIAMILDQCGVAVRTGHHCCMPLMKKLGIEGTVRASFGLYNNYEDIDVFVDSLQKTKRLLS